MSTYKTRLGRNIAVLMAAALVFTGLPGTEVQAAKKAKLSTKKLTVTVGKKKTIKIKNKAKKAKYTFKSKKASIAKVSKKGVVTGKKKGSTKITVTEKKGKKTRKLGTVKVTVKAVVKKPVATKAPAQTAPAVVTTSTPNQPTNVPDQTTSQPSTVQPTKAPTAEPTAKASKPPTPPPTDKPTPTPDPYNPSPEGGWVKLDLSSWSGSEGSYLETGNQFILDDTELETVPIPETPAIDTIGQKVEILIRGSLAEQSSGFRFWLANSGCATISQQYYFTENSVGIGTDAGNADAYQLGKPFHLQATLEHTNHDGSEDTLATTLLLKGPSYGTYLEGVTITGIWIRYGDKIGSTTEDPGASNPGVESPGVESPGADTSTGEKPASDRVLTAADFGGNDALSYTFEKIWSGSSNLITYYFTEDEIAKIKDGTYTSVDVTANIVDATQKSNAFIQMGMKGKGDQWGSKTDMFYGSPFTTDQNGSQTKTLDLTTLKNSKDDLECLAIQVEWDDPKDDKTIVFDGDIELTSITFKGASGNEASATIPDESKKSNMAGLALWNVLFKAPLPTDINLQDYSQIIYEVTVDGSTKKLNAYLYGPGLSEFSDHSQGITDGGATLDLAKYDATITDGQYFVGVQTAEEGFNGNVTLDKVTLVAKK